MSICIIDKLNVIGKVVMDGNDEHLCLLHEFFKRGGEIVVRDWIEEQTRYKRKFVLYEVGTAKSIEELRRIVSDNKRNFKPDKGEIGDLIEKLRWSVEYLTELLKYIGLDVFLEDSSVRRVYFSPYMIQFSEYDDNSLFGNNKCEDEEKVNIFETEPCVDARIVKVYNYLVRSNIFVTEDVLLYLWKKEKELFKEFFDNSSKRLIILNKRKENEVLSFYGRQIIYNWDEVEYYIEENELEEKLLLDEPPYEEYIEKVKDIMLECMEENMII